MEIHALKLLVTEADLNAVAARALAHEPQVRDVKVRLTPQGVHVGGVYPTPFMNVRFETVWELTVAEGKVAARLADVKVVGLPVGMLRGLIMNTLGDAVAKENSLHIDGDRIVFDPDLLLAKQGLTGRTGLRAVRCQAGSLVIEAGTTETA